MIGEENRKSLMKSFSKLDKALRGVGKELNQISSSVESTLSEEHKKIIGDFRKKANELAEKGDFAGIIELNKKFKKKLEDASATDKQ